MQAGERESLILEFFEVLETEINELEFGTITISVLLIDGVAVLDSLSLVKSKRRKYTGISKGQNKKHNDTT